MKRKNINELLDIHEGCKMLKKQKTIYNIKYIYFDAELSLKYKYYNNIVFYLEYINENENFINIYKFYKYIIEYIKNDNSLDSEYLYKKMLHINKPLTQLFFYRS